MSRNLLLVVAAALGFAVGCGSASGPVGNTSAPDQLAVSKFFLPEEPAGAKSVVEAKAAAKDGDEVTLVGRIGGSESPFVSGRATFTVVDTSLVPCSEMPDHACATPWDYCCDHEKLPQSTAVVKVVDGDGKTVPMDAKRDLAMKELQTVVVKGTAKRDEAGNLTVLTPAVFVKK
jgi:hypothetical protein